MENEEIKTDQAVIPEGPTTEEVEEQEEKLIKQSDVNNIVAKESKKATEKMLKDLGIEDFESAKDGLSKLKEHQEAQKTESEKQTEALQKKDKIISELQSEYESLRAKNAALGKGVLAESVDDVVALAERLVNEEVSIDEAIGKVLDKYPQFSGSGESIGTFVSPGNPTGSHFRGESDPFTEKLKKYQ